MENKYISRLHFAIDATGQKKSMVVIWVINDFDKGKHDVLSPIDIAKANIIIYNKQVDPYLFAQSYWGKKDAVRRYNISVGKVWRCLNKNQWKLLESYFRMLTKVGG